MSEQAERPMVAELRGRIAEDGRRYGGTLPRDTHILIGWEEDGDGG